jgi:hypothetical protein
MNPALTGALERGEIRRGDAFAVAPAPTLASGFPALDAELPGGGWPRGALTELLPEARGHRRARPAAAGAGALSQAGGSVLLLAPPHARMRRPGPPPALIWPACAWCFRAARAMRCGPGSRPCAAAAWRRRCCGWMASFAPACRPTACAACNWRRARAAARLSAFVPRNWRRRPPRRRCACLQAAGRQLRVQPAQAPRAAGTAGHPARHSRVRRGIFRATPCSGWHCIARRRRAPGTTSRRRLARRGRDDFWPTLACWAGRYTPRVNLGADALRLDIGASLRLFGGLGVAGAGARRSCGDGGGCAAGGGADTPGRAVAGACRRRRGLHRPGGDARGAAGVPVSVLQLSPPLARRVAGFGLRRLGELLALPRASLGARLGKPFVLDLARALGELPDPQSISSFPSASNRSWNCRRRWRRRRCCCSPRGAWSRRWRAGSKCATARCGMVLHIDHAQGAATALPLAFSLPVHQASRIERVLKARPGSIASVGPGPGLAPCARAMSSRARRAAMFCSRAPGKGGKRWPNCSIAWRRASGPRPCAAWPAMPTIARSGPAWRQPGADRCCRWR